MSKKDFENLLDKHEADLADKKFDWEKQKTEWLDFIKNFYDFVELWLNPYKNQGKVSYYYKEAQITEEYIGTYDVKVMFIDFAGQRLTLQPIGTLLIGTKGRIDMDGPRGIVQFILADKDSTGMKFHVSVFVNGKAEDKPKEHKEPEWVWKIVLREPRKIAYESFTESNFFDALMEVVNG
jgi:hypothetical protein